MYCEVPKVATHPTPAKDAWLPKGSRLRTQAHIQWGGGGGTSDRATKSISNSAE